MAGLSLGAHELNMLFYQFGLPLFLLFKIMYPTFIVIFASIINEYIEKQNNKIAIWSVRVCALAGTSVFSYAIINNLSAILRILHL
jgi:hypothetical protein